MEIRFIKQFPFTIIKNDNKNLIEMTLGNVMNFIQKCNHNWFSNHLLGFLEHVLLLGDFLLWLPLSFNSNFVCFPNRIMNKFGADITKKDKEITGN